MASNLKDAVVELQARASALPVIGLLLRAVKADLRRHSKDMAASIAYFGMLSLFPLILALIALASSVLKSENMRRQVMEWVKEFIPVGADMVTQNIDSLVRLRGAVGFTSVMVLLWSASKMVGAMSRGINHALDLRSDHVSILSPLRNFGLVVIISLLMFASTAVTPVADLLSALDQGSLPGWVSTLISILGGWLASLVSTGIMIAVTFALIPYRRPAFADLLPGLIAATLLIELGKWLFVYYVDHVSKLDALYGSITSFIILMLWMYFFGRALLFGAHVIKVHRDHRHGLDPEGKEHAET